MHGAMAHLWQPRAPPPLMNQSTDFTLVSYCVTRHLARSERAAMAKRCLAAVCFALRLLRPSLVVMGIDPTFPPPARRTLQKSATIVLIRKSLLDPMPPALHRRLYDRKCGLEVAGDASRAEAGCAFVDLGPCAFWRAKGKRRCREGAPLMIHTTWWFKAIGVIERAVGSLAAGSCASLPPRLSSEEVEQLCTHSPADQSEICRRIAH